MGYFKGLSLILGVLMMASLAFDYFSRTKWQAFIQRMIVPEKQPKWHVLVLVLMGVWVFVTWSQFFRDPRGSYFVLSLFLSFGLLKAVLFSAKYEMMRKLVLEIYIYKNEFARHFLSITSLMVAVGLLCLGIFVL